jgi:hypothetical protein
MRKRTQYKKPKPLNKIPTLIIMVITLLAIIFFGRDISTKIASLFEPNVPVSDTPNISSATGTTETPSVQIPRLSGSVMQHANTDAAQSLLPIIARGSAK